MRLLSLASSSPRRQQLLRDAGYQFETVKPDVVEARFEGEAPDTYVMRNARLKADWALNYATECERGRVVIAADTIVVHKNEILEKPENYAEARVMLKRLAGSRHQVITGVAIIGCNEKRKAGREDVFFVATEVHFKPATPAEIEWYLSTNEPLDKAGAYGAQGHGAFLVAGVIGSYTNVVGLPMAEVSTKLVGDFAISRQK